MGGEDREVSFRGGKNHLSRAAYCIADDRFLEQRTTIGRYSVATTVSYSSTPANGWRGSAEPTEPDDVDELVRIRGRFFQHRANLHFSARHLGGPYGHLLS